MFKYDLNLNLNVRKCTLWQIRQAKICLHSLLSEGAWFFGYPQSAQRRLWSDYAGASLTWHTCHKVSIRCHSSRQEGYSDFFLISRSKHMVWRIFYLFVCIYTNTCCWYSLEVPHRGASNEYPQHMFSWRNKKKCQSFWLEKIVLMELWLWFHLCWTEGYELCISLQVFPDQSPWSYSINIQNLVQRFMSSI